MTDFTIVIPTTGRDELRTLLGGLTGAEIIVVDDRPGGEPLALNERVVRSGGRGPAAARNVGWRLASTEWVAFLDDDVRTPEDWPERLAADLAAQPAEVGASQGRIVVPPPEGRRPTDDERGTEALANAQWITADMAYRRTVLAEVGGFDERFPRAYREDADLALRVRQAGYRIVDGERVTVHPARRADFFASVRAQRGNADNALLRHKFGPQWRRFIGEGQGRLGWHALTTLTAALAFVPRVRKFALGAWAGLTTEFALRRILPGPRTPGEIARMIVTSVLIPPAACWHRMRGEVAARRPFRRPEAVFFDRDDTLITDVPYLADAERVRPVPGAREALDRLRENGIPVGVVTNQSGVARGRITPEQLAAVNAHVDELLGPFGTWQVCVHGEDDGCGCRKPEPAMVRRAAEELGVDPARCVLIGDTGADVAAAVAAGARPILVPTSRTRAEEIEQAATVATDLAEAVEIALRGAP